MSTSHLLTVNEIRAKLDTSKPVEEQIKTAYKAAMNHWLITNEGEQQRCALAAVMIDADFETQESIKKELKFFEAINAASSGIPVDFGAMLDNLGESKTFGIARLWDEAKKELSA